MSDRVGTKEATKRRTETMRSFGDNFHDADSESQKVDAVIKAIWETAHNDGLDRAIMLQDLSLLSGVAVAMLSEYSKHLREVENAKADDSGSR